VQLDEICPRHDWPLYQCPPECRDGAKLPSKTWVEHPPPAYEGPRPTSDSILISPTGIAHRLAACTHLPDFLWLAPPKWGWTENAARWQEIGTHDVPATAGNTERLAQRRCLACDESY
jgi:hypothetical protein